jgi:nicotinamidase-related amidase
MGRKKLGMLMKTRPLEFLCVLLLGALALVGSVECLQGDDQLVRLKLQSRDALTGQILETSRALNSRRVGVVVMDMWSYHWCLTCAERAAAIVPRMNHALEAARDLGMTIVFTPTSAITGHEKSSQRLAARALPDASWPELKAVPYPNCGYKNEFSCRCGPGIDCPRNWGGDSMNPDLEVGADDFIAWGSREMWNIVNDRKLEQLIYIGIAADICVLGKGEGMVPMARLGIPCVLARDLTDTDSYPPKEALEHTLRVIETDLAATIDFAATLGELGYETDASLEMVQIRPWGRSYRPYLFEESLQVYLEGSASLGSEIRYTVDGSQPGFDGVRYQGPLTVSEKTSLRVQSFQDGAPVGLPSQAYFVPRSAEPPRPTLRLWELEPSRVDYSDEDSEWHVPARTWGVTMRGQEYYQGITLHAPGSIEFSIPKGATHFVALGGADDAPKGRFNAQFLGQYPSVTLQVWVDGDKLAESPTMRMGQTPWPFEVPLDERAEVLRLVVTDAGNGDRLDIGNFVRSGFVIPDYRGPRNLY